MRKVSNTENAAQAIPIEVEEEKKEIERDGENGKRKCELMRVCDAMRELIVRVWLYLCCVVSVVILCVLLLFDVFDDESLGHIFLFQIEVSHGDISVRLLMLRASTSGVKTSLSGLNHQVE